MKKLSLQSELTAGYVQIPVEFIDIYMPEASLDALRVYLYLLRASQDPSIILSVNDMADLFDVTANKIVSSLSYWESKGLLKLQYAQGEVSCITLMPVPGREPAVKYAESLRREEPVRYEEPAYQEEKPLSAEPELPAKPERSDVPSAVSAVQNTEALPDITEAAKPIDFRELSEDENFSELLGMAEFYLKMPLSSTQRTGLASCYLMYDRQAEIIEFLLEYCIGLGHSSVNYIEATCRGWKKEGLNTLQEIKNAVAARNKKVYSVMKAFGLSNRSPVENELNYIERWTSDFDLDIVTEACARTMDAIHSPNFHYADSILKAWKSAGVRYMKDIAGLDALHQKKQQKSQESEPAARKNSFRNFENRETDYNKVYAGFFDD